MEKKERNKYLLKNTIIFSIGNFSTKLISFFLVPFYTYVLTTKDYGIVDLIFTLGAVISPILMFNIHEAIKRFLLDKNRDNNAVLTIAIIVLLLGHLIGILIVPIISNINILSNYVVEIYFYTLSMTSNYIFIEYLRGIEKMKSYTICNIMASLIISILNIIFLKFLHLGVQGYFLAYIIAYYISSSIAIIIGKQYLVFKNWIFDKKLFRDMMLFSIPLIPNSLLWWITNSSDRVMVTFFIGAAANGVYAVSYKIPTIISTICNIFFQAWQFTAVKIANDKDNISYTNKVFGLYLRCVVMISSVLLILIKPIMKLYVSENYFKAWQYIPALIVGFAFSSMGTFIGTSYYVVKDMKGNMMSALFGAITNVFFNFILIPKIGISGAAIATCISYIIVFFYRYYDTRKYMYIELKHIRYLLLISSMIVLTGLCFVKNNIVCILMIIILLLEVLINADIIKEFIFVVKRKRKVKND